MEESKARLINDYIADRQKSIEQDIRNSLDKVFTEIEQKENKQLENSVDVFYIPVNNSTLDVALLNKVFEGKYTFEYYCFDSYKGDLSLKVEKL